METQVKRSAKTCPRLSPGAIVFSVDKGNGPVSAHDVASELLARLPRLGEVKLHKLLYYCQGWHLGWTASPLFSEKIEAWANGPVVADLWRARKYGEEAPAPRHLDAAMLGTVGYVVSRYGSFSGMDLIRLTHGEDPWRDATEHSGPDERCDEPIEQKALQLFFEKQAGKMSEAGRLLDSPEARQRLHGATAAHTSATAEVDDLDSLRSLIGS